MVKNPPDAPGEAGGAGWIPGSGRSPGGGNGNRSSILAGISPWTEEPGGLQFTGLQSQDTTEHACMHALSILISISARASEVPLQYHGAVLHIVT